MSDSQRLNKNGYLIRSANEQDIAQVRDIFSFYVLNTTISFMLNEPSVEYMLGRFNATTSRNLPYLVAVDKDDDTHVLGFCHASPFSADKAGYAGAVDFSLFVRPGFIGIGIGSVLLKELIVHLRENSYQCWEGNEADKCEVRAKQLYAISSADIAGRGGWKSGGEANWEWYRHKFGFKEVGRFPGIGHKFGQSVDVVYMVKDLTAGASSS